MSGPLSPTPVEDVIAYLQTKIAATYDERAPEIERMFAKEREANREGRIADWMIYRDERSRLIHDLERATEPLKRQVIAMADALEAFNPQSVRVVRDASRFAQP